MNTTRTVCTMCGHRTPRAYRHRMDSSKVAILEKIGRLNFASVPWVKVQRDGALIKEAEKATTIQCDDVHALRLHWFGLLEKRGPRTGEYCITAAGVRFLRGEQPVNAWIECLRGKVVSRSENGVTIDQVKDVILDKAYWDAYSLGAGA